MAPLRGPLHRNVAPVRSLVCGGRDVGRDANLSEGGIHSRRSDGGLGGGSVQRPQLEEVFGGVGL